MERKKGISDQQGLIGQLTLAEVRRARIGGTGRVVLLEELLEELLDELAAVRRPDTAGDSVTTPLVVFFCEPTHTSSKPYTDTLDWAMAAPEEASTARAIRDFFMDNFLLEFCNTSVAG